MYSYYQSSLGGTASSHYGPAAVTATTQQQPQWNGTQWVQPQQQPANAATQQQWNGTQWVQPQQQPTNLVQQYTNYYHQWTAIAQAKTGNEAAWAKYHADLASRAAHFFHNNPNSAAPPELTLPPAPPSTSSPPLQQQAQPQATPQNANGAMKRYVDRCLQNAPPGNKEAVTKLVQDMIQEEFQKGTLQSVDWDAKPLITLPASSSVSQHAPSSYCRPQANAAQNDISTGYYRPSVATASARVQVNTDQGNNAGYYGYSEGTSAVNTKQRNRWGTKVAAVLSNYYGPAGGDSGGPAAGSDSERSDLVIISKNKRRKVKHDKAPASKSASYYGPNSTYPEQQQQEPFGDFVKLSQQNSKKKKEQGRVGLDQTGDILASRAQRFSGPGGVKDNASKPKIVGNWDKYMGISMIGGGSKKLDEMDYEKMTVKGTCNVLEKSYLRLTAPPRPELVRPQPILEQHLKNLKEERKKGGRDYLWFCSQFKAIRQDCTVQRIQNAFTVDVYETHARIALEESDMNEFNQCQTQLMELYALLAKQKDESPKALRNQNEFIAYRLIYQTFLVVVNDAGSSDMFKIMLSLTRQQREDPQVWHALAVREASFGTDYHAFFRLRRECPTIWAGHLMNTIMPTMRFLALQRIAKGYCPTSLPVEFVLSELALSADFGRQWLESCGCVLSKDGQEFLTKDTSIHESTMEDKQSLI